MGVDSFFIHNLATNIAVDGHAEWILNPLSWFGWYPLSYPSAGPFLLADFSSVGGQPIEGSILVASMAFGGIGVLTSFVMAREFREDAPFCLLASFIYSFAPRFLAFTLWSASTRNLFMVLLPVFIWSVLRAYREPKTRNFVFVLGTFLVLATIHRLAALLAVFLIAFVASVIVVVLLRVLRTRFPRILLAKPYRRSAPFLAFGSFAGIAALMFFGTDVLSEYTTGELFNGPSVEIQLVNFGVSLARSVGLSLVLAFMGVVTLVRVRNKTLREPFLLLSFLGLTPTLFLRQYTGFYILPFIALFGALVFASLSQIKRRRVRQVVVGVLIGSVFAFSAGVLDYEVQHTTWLPNTMYATATYVHEYAPVENVVSNDGLLGIRIAALSGCAYLPVGGAGTTFQSPELLAYGFFSPQEVEANTVRVPIQELTLESDSPWIASTIQAEADWVAIMQASFESSVDTIARYDPSFYLENENLASTFFAYGNRYPSLFATSAHASAYKIYDNDVETLWYVAVPRTP
ncbi:MAG TPA: hypothetical protein VJ326_10130 [Thermoplasmata archaeon]|nr:hypothetical protein [Thermoplasmata archaeon]